MPLWLSPGSLHLPPAPVPLILVGPGTGCAPFRSFIHHRAALAHHLAATDVRPPQADPTSGGAAEEDIGPVIFFFGCRHEDKDFLYREEWEGLRVGAGAPLAPERGGGFFAAFSRDQEKKVRPSFSSSCDAEPLSLRTSRRTSHEQSSLLVLC